MKFFSRTFLPKWQAILALGFPTSLLLSQQPQVVSVVAPTTAEKLAQHPSLPEPLMPLVEVPSTEETAALAAAVVAWDKRTRGDDFSALEAFVVDQHQSAWTASVQLNLGLLYYRAGYFSRALAAFSDSWQGARVGAVPAAEALANRAVTELALMYARIGRKEDLAKLLDEIKTRKFQGFSQIQMERSSVGLQGMNERPEISFRCGPYALGNLAKKRGVSVPLDFNEQTPSTPQGFSLAQLKEMAQQKLGMEMQVVKRSAVAPVPTPAVMHFKCLHFGALVGGGGNGYYQLVDPTFGNDTWLTREAVDDESSGYFLVPAGPLPEGCVAATDEEAGALFGRGNATDVDEGCTKCSDLQTGGTCPFGETGMASYTIHLMRASLAVTDTPIALPGSLGDTLALTCSYHQREATNVNTALFTHFGAQWVNNMISRLTEDTFNSAASVRVYLPGGGYETFSGYDNATKLFARSPLTGAQLYRSDAGLYELRIQDGSKLVYGRTVAVSGTRQVFLTAMVDSWGSQTTFQYDTEMDETNPEAPVLKYPFRVRSVTSPSGRVLHFFYSHPTDPYAVTDVADNAMLAEAYKKVHFSYQTVSGSTQRLVSITDPVGIKSAFTYDGYGTMTTLTTPYGTTVFKSSPVGAPTYERWVTATDPQGDTEKVMASSVPPPAPAMLPNGVRTQEGYLMYRNTFHWSKVMYKAGPDDITKAHAYHWLHDPVRGNAVIGVLECEKPPLQDYIWYSYPGQENVLSYTGGSASTPSAAATVVEGANGDLVTSMTKMSYHPISGKLAGQATPAGTQVRYLYDSVSGGDTENPGTDLTKIQVFDPTVATWTTLKEVTAYQNHVPVTYIDEQGTAVTLTLNAQGQSTQITRSATVAGVTRSETARITYTETPSGAVPAWAATSFGYLRKVEVTDPVNVAAFVTVMQYAYDAHGRLLSETDAEGYTLAYAYDALDRMTQVLFPDGTTQLVDYAQDGQMILSPTKVTERDGRVTRHRYNALGQRSATIDAKQQPTFFEWCLCGDIKKLTDAKGQVTTWRHDIQGRVTAKISPDGKTTSYQFYPASGQLKSVTLPNDQTSGQPTYTLKYDVAGRVVKQDYTSPGTADVTIDSFDFLGRVKQMTDGLGTNSWSYHPFGQPGGGSLHVMDGPLQHDALHHSYTHFGRLLRTENVDEGSTVRQFVQYTYDLMGRSSTVITDMGLNTLEYAGITAKLESVTQQIGLVDAMRSNYGLFPSTDPVNRGRLQNITHSFPAGGGIWTAKVEHDYTYDVAGRMNSWRWRSPAFDMHAAVDRRWEAGHDATDQLESIVSYSGATGTILEKWSYAYDLAGNRSYEEHGGVGIIATYAGANRLQRRGGAGALHVSGTVNKAAAVTVNDQPARVTSTVGGAPYRFAKDVTAATGTQTFTIKATDGATPPQTTTQTYSVEVSVANQTYAHDDNGNITKVRNGDTLAVVRSYEWDAANRLVKIVYADNGSTEFQYDGLSQRRVITERSPSNTVTSVTRLLWEDGRVWQEQDSSGRVTERYHLNGVQMLNYSGDSQIPVNVESRLALRDHLGSWREEVIITGNTPVIAARSDYDSYGKDSHVGSVGGNAAYTGHYLHRRSGLELTLYRAYFPEAGRWLNEDPIAEQGGLNLYAYTGNSPWTKVDPLGLDTYLLNNTQALGRFGHSALMVGNADTGYEYRSFSASKWGTCSDNLERKFFWTLDEAMKYFKAQKYERYAVWRTDSLQDHNAIQAIDSEYNNNSYNLLGTRTCTLMARHGMQAAGIKVIDSSASQAPNKFYDQNAGQADSTGNFK